MTQVYKDLDKKFKKYDHTRIQDFGKVSKYLKTKFSKGSSLPDTVASFYNDYRGGEDMKKNIDKLTKYAKKMSGYKKESVDEAIKNWNDVPKKGTIDFGKYGKYVILSKNRLRVSGKFVSGTNKGKKVIWYSRDGQKDYRKRKGLSLADTPSFPFNQVKESVKEADLGLTYKRGKTVKVKHKKSGKTLVIVDKPVVRKEYEKIGYFAESVNEKVNPEMKKIYQLLIKYGNSAKDATAMIKKNLKYVNKTYRNSTPRGKAIALVGLSSLGESVNEGQKRMASTILNKFNQAYIKFSREVRDVIKMMDRSTGSKVDGKIIDKAYSKGLIPLDKLMQEWGRGQQSNPKIDEKVIKVSKKDDVPGNAMKMSGEEKIKKLTYSGSNGKGSYEIKGKNLNVIGIRPRDKGFFVRHFTMKTGFRKANLYYDGVNFMDKNKKF